MQCYTYRIKSLQLKERRCSIQEKIAKRERKKEKKRRKQQREHRSYSVDDIAEDSNYWKNNNNRHIPVKMAESGKY